MFHILRDADTAGKILLIEVSMGMGFQRQLTPLYRGRGQKILWNNMSSVEFSQLISQLRTFHAEGRLNSEESLATMREYGAKIFRLGKLDEAEIIFGDCISRSVFHHGTTSEGSMVTMTKLCEVYSAAKRHGEAERVYFLFYEMLAAEVMQKFADDLLKVQELTELWKKYGREKEVNLLSDFHHNLQMSASNADPVLAVKASHQFALSKASDMTFGDFEKIQNLFSNCLNQAKSALEPGNEQIFRIRFDHAVFLEERGRKYAEAEKLYSDLIEERKGLQDPMDSLLLMIALQYGKLMFTLGHYTKAVNLLSKMLIDISECSDKTQQSNESKDIEKKIKLQLAFIHENLGKNNEAVALLENLDFSNQQDTLDGLLNYFTYLRIQDGLLPVPVTDPNRSTIYDELHRGLRGKLGVEIANLQGTWSSSRLPYMRALAQLSSRSANHASEAVSLFDALIRNATHVFGKEHPFTVSSMIDAMEFHVFRLNTKDLSLLASLANELLQASTNFMKNSEVNSNHMSPKIAQFLVWMCAKSVLKEDISEMIVFWETYYPARKFETSRLNIMLSKIFCNGQVAEAESLIRIQVTNAPPLYRTYITVLGEKALLDVMLNRLVAVKAIGSMAREETKTLYRQIIGLYRHLYGASYPMVLSLTYEAGTFFEEADMQDLSEALYLESQDILTKESNENISSEVKARIAGGLKVIQERLSSIYAPANINNIYQRAEKNRQDKSYATAEPLYYAVIRRRTKALGADAYETLVARNSLAVMMWNTRRLDEAQVILEDCLAIRRGTSGDLDAFTLRILFNLSNIYKYQGHLDKAEACYSECVKGRRATLGDNQKETLNAMYYLGLAIAAQHRYREAHPVLQECQALRIAAFGQNTATVTEVYNAMQAYSNDATMNLMLRSAEQATKEPYQDHVAAAHYYAEALFIYKLTFPTGVPETNSTVPLIMGNVGVEQRRAFQLHQAEMTLKDALGLYALCGGHLHDKSLRTRSQLAETILLQNRSVSEATVLYESLIYSTRNLDDKRFLARIAFDLAKVFLNCFHLNEARRWFQEALQAAISSTGFNESSTSVVGTNEPLSFIDISTVEENILILESILSDPDEALFQQALILRRKNCEEEAQWILRRSSSNNTTALQIRLNDACPLLNITYKSFRLTWVMPEEAYQQAVVYVPTPSIEKPKDIASSEYSAVRSLPKFSLLVSVGGEETSTDALLGFAGEKSPLAAIAHLPVIPTNNNNATASGPVAVSAASNAAAASASFSFAPPPSISSTNNPPVQSFGVNFGQPSAPTQGSLFGNSSNNGFGSGPNTGSGLFSNNNNNTGSGLFSNNNNNTGSGLFSNSNNTSTGGGLFSNNNNNTGSGLFSNSNNNAGGGFFSNNNNNSTGGGLFGNNMGNSTTTSSSLFGGGVRGDGGGTSTSGSLFGNISNNTNNSNNSGFSFGAAATSATNSLASREGSGGLFASNNNTQPTPAFSSSPFSAPTFNNTSAPVSSAPIFGGFSFGSASTPAASAAAPIPAPAQSTSAPASAPAPATGGRRIVRSSRNRR